MKKQEEIISKYRKLFGQEKKYLDILEECHKKIKFFKDITFTMNDFKNDKDFQENLLLIDSYRKYSIMDDFLLGTNDYSLILLEHKEGLNQKVTYHDIMEAIELYNETFEKMKTFCIAKNFNCVNGKIEVKTVLTINDIFNHQNESQFTLYFIESAKTYYFGMIFDDYEYLFSLPFEEVNLDLENNQKCIIYGYLYLIQEYVLTRLKDNEKTEIFTTLFKEYGVTYEEYLKKPTSTNTYAVYNTTLKPFLIEPSGLTYYPRMNQLKFDVVDLLVERKEQHKDFYLYFKELKFNKEAAEKYVRDNWIINYDIGRIYGIDFNIVANKNDIGAYKEAIIQRKLTDIELNFHMYKKHGLIKYNQDKEEGFPKEGYTVYLKEFLSAFETNKKDRNTENDIRINLDSDKIFRIGKSIDLNYQHSINAFEHSNIILKDRKLFKEGKKNISIQAHLEEFIFAYNAFKKKEILEMNYEWYFPYKQLHDYVENVTQSFCHIRSISGVREEEFNVLRDVFFYKGKDRKKILEHQDFIYDTKKYFIQSRNPYYFEVPVVLELQMDLKEFNQIEKGIHPIFKSLQSENLLKEKTLKLTNEERFLNKKEIIQKSDFEVVFTGTTNKNLNLQKGIKGTIISCEKEIIIEDELGIIHTETFRSVGKSGWKHLSTMSYNEFFSKLELSEKAFLDNKRNRLIDKQ